MATFVHLTPAAKQRQDQPLGHSGPQHGRPSGGSDAGVYLFPVVREHVDTYPWANDPDEGVREAAAGWSGDED